MKKPIKFIHHSVHQKLLNLRDKTHRPFNELLQHFFIERFLYRLSQSSYKDRFILKGGLMLKLWYGIEARPTKDIDMLGRVNNSIDNLKNIVKDIISVSVPDDGIVFDPNSVEGEEIRKDSEYQGVRVILKGSFDKIPVHIQIDFGFGDVVSPKPNWVDYPQLLNFGIPRLQVYSVESLIAEKYHAIVYLGEYNTRLKDFYDIYLLAQNNNFDGDILSTAILATFHNRSTAIPSNTPVALSEGFYQDKEKLNLWKAFLEKSNLAYIDFHHVTQLLAKFLIPLSLALSNNQPFILNWSPNETDQWH
jgi:predicted nucleotidyltransferase component of viral defense system